MRDLTSKQQKMRARQITTRQHTPKPLTKSELILLLSKKIRDSKTSNQAFAAMTRQLAELKGWLRVLPGSSTKPRTQAQPVLEDPKEKDDFQLILDAEDALRNQANDGHQHPSGEED